MSTQALRAILTFVCFGIAAYVFFGKYGLAVVALVFGLIQVFA